MFHRECTEHYFAIKDVVSWHNCAFILGTRKANEVLLLMVLSFVI